MCSLTEHAQVTHFQKRNKIALQRQHMFAVTENGHALFAFVQTDFVTTALSTYIKASIKIHIFFKNLLSILSFHS